jgi:uncharacterized membrane protein YwzB
MDETKGFSKGIIVTMAITAVVTYPLLQSFLKGNIVKIPKGTLEGDMIIVTGMVVIMIGTALLSFGGFVLFLRLKKYFQK